MFDIDAFLRQMADINGSDLYIAPGVPPRINVDGNLRDAASETLTPKDTRDLVKQMLMDEQWKEFLVNREMNFAYSIKGVARYRVNVYFQRNTIASVIRQIRSDVPDFESLHLPELLGELISGRQGLILVTGATGSGKSTTMAAMIDHRAMMMDGHIVTVEDPIEYVFRHGKSIITQREVGIDTMSFKVALKNTLRQAPNVIYIGELRDAETVEFALHSAETGHLVLATLHSSNAPQTVERVLNFFPKESHHQVLMQLSYNMRAIVCQRLVPAAEDGRLPVMEILINSALARETIQKGALGELKKIMSEGSQEGMQTFDMHLKKYVDQKKVEEDVALKYADSPSDLRLRLRGFKTT